MQRFASIVRLNDPIDIYFSDQKLPSEQVDNTGWYASMRGTLRINGDATFENALDIYFDPGNQTMDELLFGDQLKLELKNSKLNLSKTKCIAVDTSSWGFWTTLLLFSDGRNEYLLSPGGYAYNQNFLDSADYKTEERRQFVFEANQLYNFHTEVLPFLLEEDAISRQVTERVIRERPTEDIE